MKKPIKNKKLILGILVFILWTGVIAWFFSTFYFQNPIKTLEFRCLVCARQKMTPQPEKHKDKPSSVKISITPTPVQSVKTEYEIVMAQKHGEVLWKIYQLETERGKTDNCRITGQGYGGFGVMYAGKVICYETFEKATERAEYWLSKLNVDKDLAVALCTWNLGVAQPMCNYSIAYQNL